MYEPHEIDISYKYLKTVVDRLEEPICLIGGYGRKLKEYYWKSQDKY